MMNNFAVVVSIAAGLVAAAAALGRAVKWIFRRGVTSGCAQMEHQAELKAQAHSETRLRAMTERMAELEGELDWMRRHRRGA
jgi:hypothetical protein